MVLSAGAYRFGAVFARSGAGQQPTATPCRSCARICFAVPSVSTSALLGMIAAHPAHGSGLATGSVAQPAIIPELASSSASSSRFHGLRRRIRQALYLGIGFMT